MVQCIACGNDVDSHGVFFPGHVSGLCSSCFRALYDRFQEEFKRKMRASRR